MKKKVIIDAREIDKILWQNVRLFEGPGWFFAYDSILNLSSNKVISLCPEHIIRLCKG